MIRRLLLAAAIPVVLLAGLAVASSGSEGDDRTVVVTMDEYTLTGDRTTVPAGEVRFESRNTGAIDHELLVVRTQLAPEDLPLGLEGPAVTLAGKVVLGEPHKHTGILSDGGGALSRHVRPGGRLSESVNLTPGDYVLLCSLPGHYQAGQATALTVSG